MYIVLNLKGWITQKIKMPLFTIADVMRIMWNKNLK